jgi:Domain of unknown function (DUF5063)
MSGSESDVAAFVAAAREYCGWVEHEPYDADTDRFTALVLVSKLYASALRLPRVDVESTLGSPANHSPVDEAREEKAMARMDAFPTRTYWRLDGGTEEGGEKVEDDVGRDLFLTYAAVRPLLDVFDSGVERRGWAIWAWRFGFWGDWGRHSSNAIQVLHKCFHDRAWNDRDHGAA